MFFIIFITFWCVYVIIIFVISFFHSFNKWHFNKWVITTTAWKEPVFEIFPVLIFTHVDWIRTRKTPHVEIFHAVYIWFIFNLSQCEGTEKYWWADMWNFVWLQSSWQGSFSTWMDFIPSVMSLHQVNYYFLFWLWIQFYIQFLALSRFFPLRFTLLIQHNSEELLLCPLLHLQN